MAGGGQDLGSATFRVTLDDSDLRNKLKTLKADIEALKVGPVKLNADGTGTRSKTNTADAAAKKDAAAEARRQSALQTLESKRFRIARQINQLEERGVNVDRLRSKLEKDRFSTGTKSSLAQLQAANQTTRQLSRQVALSKDLADKNKRAATTAKTTDTPATTAPAKEPRQPARGIDRAPLQGSVREVGSPAFGTRGARMGGASQPVGGKRDSANVIEDLNIQQSRLKRNSRNKGIPLSGDFLQQANKLGGQIGEAAGKGQIDTVKRLEKELKLLIRAETERLAVVKQTADALKGQKTPAAPATPAKPAPTAPNPLADFERLTAGFKKKPPAARPLTEALKTFQGLIDEEFADKIKKPRKPPVPPVPPVPPGPPPVPPRLTPQEREARRADKQRKQEQGAALNSGLVGGAFPLMFGQGGFASIGGALGGSIGGGELGFGLSLVGTLIGSQIDELNKRFGELGTALRAPIESLDVFIAQATLASSVQDKLAKTLVEGGQLGAAEQLIRTESARTVDPIVAEGVAANNEKFNRALSDTKDILGQLTAGPTSAFLAFLAGLLNTVNNVPAANPDTPAAERLETTRKRATSDKQIAQSSSFGNIFALGQANFAEGTERAAGSKKVLAIETRLTKEKQAQKSLEAAALQAKGQGRKELADNLAAQAKVTAIQAELTAGESAIQQEFARNNDGRNDGTDLKVAYDKLKVLRESSKLQKQLAETESSAAAASSTISAKKAKDLQGFEGGARTLRDKQLDVQLARDKTKEARSALDQSTPASRKVAADGLTTAKNNQFIAQIELERTQLSLQNDLNQSLQSEVIIRKGIAQQITAAIAQQGAALAKADSGANPGNSVLAARAGRAEGDAFKEQNKAGINAAKSNESQLRSALQFNLDSSKTTELVSKIQTAAEATKLAYIEAGTALAEKIGAASASLAGMRDSLRGTLEGNIDLIPGQDIQNLRNMAQADINRGQQKGILRSDLGPAEDDKEQFRRAGFVRDVENKTAQIKSQEELIKALNENTTAERNITVQVELGGSPVPVGDRTASTL